MPHGEVRLVDSYFERLGHTQPNAVGVRVRPSTFDRFANVTTLLNWLHASRLRCNRFEAFHANMLGSVRVRKLKAFAPAAV